VDQRLAKRDDRAWGIKREGDNKLNGVELGKLYIYLIALAQCQIVLRRERFGWIEVSV